MRLWRGLRLSIAFVLLSAEVVTEVGYNYA